VVAEPASSTWLNQRDASFLTAQLIPQRTAGVDPLAVELGAANGRNARNRPFRRRSSTGGIGHYVELYIMAVMHIARLCAGRGRSKAAGRVNAGAAGILGDHALHITFAFWRGVPRANSLVTRQPPTP
jgi:hypothetical protein